jgi:hypothetical protein
MLKNFGGMGFRDMKLFSKALLARQAWRLIQYPNSLCAWILQAKYYPNGELVDTAFQRDVPTWKAIEHGLELVKKGIIWHIRSGTKVNIWRDPWISRQPSFKISLKKGRSRIRWVSQLMKDNLREWDEQVLRTCMYPHDIEAAQQVRPAQLGEEDIVAWFYEKSGMEYLRSRVHTD